MTQTTFPYMYINDPDKGKPIANGSIYIGEVDKDPENFPIAVSGKQEDGTVVSLTQPISTSAGGIPTYNGSPVLLQTTESTYSLRVKSSLGAVKYEQAIVEGVSSSSDLDDYSDYVTENYSKTFETVTDMVADATLIIGQKVTWMGYSTLSDGGSNWGIVKAGAHTEDGGSIFSLGVDIYVEANLKGKRINVRKFGAVSGDSTTPFVNAFAYALANGQTARIPANSERYLITESLPWAEGLQIEGRTLNSLPTSFGVDPVGSVIDFQPTVLSDLFVTSGTPHKNFRLHYALKNLSMIGGNANAQAALDLNGVIYGNFSTLAIQDFVNGITCNATIMNRFESVYIGNSSDASVVYEGVQETTDVWSKCTLFGAPEGVRYEGSSISIRWAHCNFEQLDNYGMKMAKECQSITLDHCNAEDVPFTANANGAMFKLGYTGSALVAENHLIVTGGKYAGRNAGTVGSFVDADFCNSAIISSVNVSRFTTGFKTTAQTANNAIQLGPVRGVSVATWYNDVAKVNGIIPNDTVGQPNANSRLKTPLALVSEIRSESGVSNDGTVVHGSKYQVFPNMQTFADDTAAGVGGVPVNALYKTAAGEVRIKL